MTIRLEFKPQDCWIGVFWKRGRYHNSATGEVGSMTDVWICVLPLLPVHIRWFHSLAD